MQGADIHQATITQTQGVYTVSWQAARQP